MGSLQAVLGDSGCFSVPLRLWGDCDITKDRLFSFGTFLIPIAFFLSPFGLPLAKGRVGSQQPVSNCHWCWLDRWRWNHDQEAVSSTLHIKIQRAFGGVDYYSDVFVQGFEASRHVFAYCAPQHPYVDGVQDHMRHFQPGDKNPEYIGFMCLPGPCWHFPVSAWLMWETVHRLVQVVFFVPVYRCPLPHPLTQHPSSMQLKHWVLHSASRII